MLILSYLMLVMTHLGFGQSGETAYLLMVRLLFFGVIFAVNSSLHSYLIISLAGEMRATMDVGFYYSANAAGRLLRTLLSGLTYQLGGVVLSLFISSVLALLSCRLIAKLE